MKQEQRYIWISKNAPVILFARELESLFKDSRYDPENDKIFELGPEVKLKMQVVLNLSEPVTRNHVLDR
jgi:hypothetical protein